jgi:hypothetical protein
MGRFHGEGGWSRKEKTVSGEPETVFMKAELVAALELTAAAASA